jgi:hypothetical protein
MEETVSSLGGAIDASLVTSSISQHPLLWYRLFPNLTYGNGMGILLGLLIAVGPLVLLLIYIVSIKAWNPNGWQKLALILPLAAFFAVGAVVSTKIGGGGDLHNLDMFLIGLLFTGLIAWKNGGRQWLGKIDSSPIWVKILLVLLFVVPGIQPLSALRSYQFAEDLPWLVTMTDVSYGKFLEMLPVQDDINEILSYIRKNVDARKEQGEILFIDQRQLLTFGYLEKVPLVPEYEKKVLMNEAMAENHDYFYQYYTDLASKRFSLIISDPLRRPTKDSEAAFGEENNYWVDWVVKPTLCYYVPIETFTEVQIQLLVPREGDADCSSKLPFEIETNK